MSGPACPTIAPCSQPSTPLRAAVGGGLRPALTAAPRGASRGSGRDGETPFSRTKKHACSYGSAILQNLTHATSFRNKSDLRSRLAGSEVLNARSATDGSEQYGRDNYFPGVKPPGCSLRSTRLWHANGHDGPARISQAAGGS
jgi:hypothetical protein